jgi:hypothetical protein
MYRAISGQLRYALQSLFNKFVVGADGLKVGRETRILYDPTNIV